MHRSFMVYMIFTVSPYQGSYRLEWHRTDWNGGWSVTLLHLMSLNLIPPWAICTYSSLSSLLTQCVNCAESLFYDICKVKPLFHPNLCKCHLHPLLLCYSSSGLKQLRRLRGLTCSWSGSVDYCDAMSWQGGNWCAPVIQSSGGPNLCETEQRLWYCGSSSNSTAI